MELPFEHYLVGGAVRDKVLGRDVVDRDWVVVGAKPKELKKLGFKQVGRDFPVFLHPQTREEYALARTERNSGPGHTGFTVHSDPSVTLEEDLVRRDLTINAIAQSSDGAFIDPFGGLQDLKTRTLRHVSAAFCEDPLRVFRVARFAAQLEGFVVAESTQLLMTEMCARGDLETLSAERVWIELQKALCAPEPLRFFAVLAGCTGLSYWFGEVDYERLTFNPVPNVYRRYIDLMLASGDDAALSKRLKVPRAYRQIHSDWQFAEGALRAWQTVDAAVLADAFVYLKVPHSLDRLAAVLSVSEQIENPDQLNALASGFACIELQMAEKKSLQGKAYGDALRKAQEAWLCAQRESID